MNPANSTVIVTTMMATIAAAQGLNCVKMAFKLGIGPEEKLFVFLQLSRKSPAGQQLQWSGDEYWFINKYKYR
jgi:hypothetical protein